MDLPLDVSYGGDVNLYHRGNHHFIYITQPKQSDDEDFGMAPMEVNSSSSDNIFRAEVPKQA
eukprot:6306365-Pyramimonas_sp.AAC.1